MERQGKQRVAMNEATFRKVNEGMEAGQDPSGLLSFVCECGRLNCTRILQLTRAEYEAIRANPRRFAVVDGHEILEAKERLGDDLLVVATRDAREGAEKRLREVGRHGRLAGWGQD